MKLPKKIQKYLKGKAYVVNTIVCGKNGVPDIICCYRGKFVGIEVKEGGDKLSALQVANIRKIKHRGGYAIEARSVSDVDTLLWKIDLDIMEKL